MLLMIYDLIFDVTGFSRSVFFSNDLVPCALQREVINQKIILESALFEFD